MNNQNQPNIEEIHRKLLELKAKQELKLTHENQSNNESPFVKKKDENLNNEETNEGNNEENNDKEDNNKNNEENNNSEVSIPLYRVNNNNITDTEIPLYN